MSAARFLPRPALLLAPFALAVDGLRAHGMRAAVAIGGVAIGVAPVLLIVTVMTGMRGALARDFGQVDRESFVVTRSNMLESMSDTSTTNRAITLDEVRLLTELPDVESASASVDATLALEISRQRVPEVDVEGTTVTWPDDHGGEFLAGRNFAIAEQTRGAPVAVISSALARRIARDADPLGAMVRLDGEPFRVVGVYRETPSLLTDTTRDWVRTPYTTALRVLPVDAEWMEVRVTPRAGVSRADAEEAVTARLRAARRLGPRQADTFVLMGRESLDAVFDQYAGTLFAAMLLLTGLALVVGGVGVVGIMTVSIAERTVEIGVKRALGATRRAIASQFLLETVAITSAGGVIGLALGVLATLALRTFSPIPAELPVWALVATLATTSGSGVGLGLYPAVRAANLDPAEALRRTA